MWQPYLACALGLEEVPVDPPPYTKSYYFKAAGDLLTLREHKPAILCSARGAGRSVPLVLSMEGPIERAGSRKGLTPASLSSPFAAEIEITLFLLCYFFRNKK